MRINAVIPACFTLALAVGCGTREAKPVAIEQEIERWGGPDPSIREPLYRYLPDRVSVVVDYGIYMNNPSSPEYVAAMLYPDYGTVVERKVLFISKHGNPCFEVTLQKADKWKVKP